MIAVAGGDSQQYTRPVIWTDHGRSRLARTIVPIPSEGLRSVAASLVACLPDAPRRPPPSCCSLPPYLFSLPLHLFHVYDHPLLIFMSFFSFHVNPPNPPFADPNCLPVWNTHLPWLLMRKMSTLTGPPTLAHSSKEGRSVSNDGVNVRSLSFGREPSVSTVN